MLAEDISDQQLYELLERRWHQRILKESEQANLEAPPKLQNANGLLEFVYQCYKSVALCADPDLKELSSVSVALDFETVFECEKQEHACDSTAHEHTETFTVFDTAFTRWSASVKSDHHKEIELSLIPPERRRIAWLLEDAMLNEISTARALRAGNRAQSREATRAKSRERLAEALKSGRPFVKSSSVELDEQRLCRWCGVVIPENRDGAYGNDKCVQAAMDFFKDMKKLPKDAHLRIHVFNKVIKVQKEIQRAGPSH